MADTVRVTTAGGNYVKPAPVTVGHYMIRTDGTNDASFKVYDGTITDANICWEDACVGADLAKAGVAKFGIGVAGSDLTIVPTGTGGAFYFKFE